MEEVEKDLSCCIEAQIYSRLTQLQQLQVRKGDFVIEFSNKIDSIVNELAATGLEVIELENKCTFLRGLRNDFAIPAQIIATTGTNYNDAIAQLVTYETTLEQVDNPEKHAMVTFNRPANNKHDRKCFFCGKKAHKKRLLSNPKSENYKGENAGPEVHRP